uniref:Ell-associated factor Eaf n=1 Tax=Drosophila pseudoobscura pseudoobscura TaxID=46245 RepID=EAF_DROPS|nr:RecName: Full=Ell-associated factor Eaf [Drosophila pseudoobscura pseudoobscura]
MMMTKQKNTLAERLNIGDEVRELKLGSTFNPKNTSTAFHTIKYDFKPASVDTSRMATVDVGSNNQVTVIVPNSELALNVRLLIFGLTESSGVPHTVYKGNQREYAKECLMIYDKETGAITIEKLNHNIQVKKTRTEVTNKPVQLPAQSVPMNMGHQGQVLGTNGSVPPPMAQLAQGPLSGPGGKLENSTMRVSSKTKVSTGSRRNNIIDFKPRNSPMQQSSPSRPVVTHRSPQSAPAWDANNAQQTLPSIPMITDDDDFGLRAALHNGGQANISGSSTGSSSGQPDLYGSSSSSHMGKQRQAHGKRQQIHQRSSPPVQQQPHYQQQQQPNYGRAYNGASNYAQQQQPQPQQQRHSPHQQPHQQQHQRHSPQQQQQRHSPQQLQQQRPTSYGHSNNMPMDLDSSREHDLASQSVAQAAAVLEQQIGGALSASSSSSESDSSDSDSGSDSDDSTEDDRSMKEQQEQQQQQQLQHQQLQLQHQQIQQPAPHHQRHQQQQSQQHMNQLPNLGLGSISPSYNNHHNHQQPQPQPQQQQMSGVYASNGGFPNDLLQNDLQLSSNSSDDDD